MAGECDLVLVVGSTNSSNSVRLVEVALEAGARDSHLVDFAVRDRRRPGWTGVGTVGVTSGASVPEILVSEVLDWLAERGYADVETVKAAEERLVFALPHELRKAPLDELTRRAVTVGRRAGRLSRRRSAEGRRNDPGCAGEERQRRAIHRNSASTIAAPVAMAIVGNPPDEQGRHRGQVEAAPTAPAPMLTAATATKTSGGATTTDIRSRRRTRACRTRSSRPGRRG